MEKLWQASKTARKTLLKTVAIGIKTIAVGSQVLGEFPFIIIPYFSNLFCDWFIPSN